MPTPKSSNVHSLRKSFHNETVFLPNGFAQSFETALRDIFGSNLTFGFVFGSFAKGYALKHHDIDTLICLHEKNEEQRQAYGEWVQEMHNRYGCNIDPVYPFEIMTLEDLNEAAEYLQSFEPKAEGNSALEFDYVVWAQIMADTKLYIVGSVHMVQKYEEAFAIYPERWKEIALAQLERQEIEEKKLKEQEPLFFIKRFFKFP